MTSILKSDKKVEDEVTMFVVHRYLMFGKGSFTFTCLRNYDPLANFGFFSIILR